LADENIPKILVRKLVEKSIDVVWLSKTEHRGITDEEVVNLANNLGRTILTRNSDFTKRTLLSKAKHGILYLAEPVAKNNLDELANTIENTIKHIVPEKGILIIIKTNYVEIIHT